MKKQDGVALIATLLIMAAIMALGVGTLFLSNMNLRIAENSYTHALARYNAEAGMEAAIIKLRKDFEDSASTPKQFPEFLTLPNSPDITYQPVSADSGDSKYETYSLSGVRSQARVVVIGTGPNGARYQTEAFLGTEKAGFSDPFGIAAVTVPFPRGLASESIVAMSGSPTLKNAPLHGNRGYDLSGSGSYQHCLEGGISCTALSGSHRPVTGATGMSSYECKASGGGNNGLCSGERPSLLIEPIDFLKDVPYAVLRNGDEVSPSKFGVSSADTRISTTAIPGCTHIVTSLAVGSPPPAISPYPKGSKVCVTGNVTLASTTYYADINIIAKGDVTVSTNATFKNVNLLSMGTLNLGGNVRMDNTRLFGDTQVNFNGAVNYSNLATIASGGDVKYNNGSRINNPPSGTVSLAIMAVRNFEGNGMQGSDNGYVNAAIWAGGTATVSGSSKIRGGIAAAGVVSFSGSAEVYGQATFNNSDLADKELRGTMEDVSVASLSRR